MRNAITDLYSSYYAPFIKESYLEDEAIFKTPYHTFFMTQVLIAIIAAHGLNILLGYTGQISLGHAAFLGVGGYAYSFLVMVHHWPFWMAIPASGMVAAGLGLIIGIPSLRIKGIYLGVATIAFQFIADYTYFHWTTFSGGPQGRAVEAPVLFGQAMTSKIFFTTFAWCWSLFFCGARRTLCAQSMVAALCPFVTTIFQLRLWVYPCLDTSCWALRSVPFTPA